MAVCHHVARVSLGRTQACRCSQGMASAGRKREGRSRFARTANWTRRVKRWRGAQMVPRWGAAALVVAEKGFRRMQGGHISLNSSSRWNNIKPVLST